MAESSGSGFTEPTLQLRKPGIRVDSVKFEPPPQITKPKYKGFDELKAGGWYSAYDFMGTHHWRKKKNSCVRTKYCPGGPLGPPKAGEEWAEVSFMTPMQQKDVEHHGQHTHAAEKSWDTKPYIVVGVMGVYHPIPREVIMKIDKHGALFTKIREAERKDRPLIRRLLSLKHVSGFGLYECNPVKGYHSPVELDHTSQMVLSEFFLDYKSGEPDYGDRWNRWVQKELNQQHGNPADGRYALELLLRWDPVKIVLWGFIAVAFSVAIGFWYEFSGGQFEGAGPSDQSGITQTAWTISSYILTAASLLIALLAAITQIGDV